MGVSWRECGGGVSLYSRVDGFELLIQLESLKPWPETSKLMRWVEFHKNNCQTGSQVCGIGWSLLTGRNRRRKIWVQSSRKVRTKIVKVVNNAAHRCWRIGIILEQCFENKVLRQNSILRKSFSFACQDTWKTMFIGRCRGCMQASWRYMRMPAAARQGKH